MLSSNLSRTAKSGTKSRFDFFLDAVLVRTSLFRKRISFIRTKVPSPLSPTPAFMPLRRPWTWVRSKIFQKSGLNRKTESGQVFLFFKVRWKFTRYFSKYDVFSSQLSWVRSLFYRIWRCYVFIAAAVVVVVVVRGGGVSVNVFSALSCLWSVL